jgi:signal peptidase I
MSSGLTFEKNATDTQIHRVTHPSMKRDVLSYMWYFLKVFLLVALIYTFMRTSVIDTISIKGDSMQPNFATSDVVYIDEITPKFGDYRRGDVVIFNPDKLNQNPVMSVFSSTTDSEKYIKRVIGLPGEKVAFQNGKVYIITAENPNGVPLDEKNYLPSGVITLKNDSNERYEETILGADEYYVLGDNRTVSSDSRVLPNHGIIHKNTMWGRVFYRKDPSTKAGWIPLPNYNIRN